MERFNNFEHNSNLINFQVWFTMSAFIGIFAGALIDKAVKKIQKTNTTRAACFGYLWLQIALVACIFYAGIYLFKHKFDDFTWSSWCGCMGLCLFYTVQTTLVSNITCVLN